jgi:hypothetical protein
LEVLAEMLETVVVCTFRTIPCDVDGQVDEDLQIRSDAASREHDDGSQLGQIDPPSVSLVRKRRSGEPIAHDPPPVGQSRLDYLFDVLCPVGCHQQRLCTDGNAASFSVEEQRPQFGAERGCTRLGSEEGAEGTGKQVRLSRLAGPVDAFEHDEPASARVGRLNHDLRRYVSAVSEVDAAAFATAPAFAALVAFFAVLEAFFVVFEAFFVVFDALAVLVAFFAVFVALAAFAARPLLTGGPAARRSASNSDARSIVMLSMSSPRRSDALVVPSVT